MEKVRDAEHRVPQIPLDLVDAGLQGPDSLRELRGLADFRACVPARRFQFSNLPGHHVPLVPQMIELPLALAPVAVPADRVLEDGDAGGVPALLEVRADDLRLLPENLHVEHRTRPHVGVAILRFPGPVSQLPAPVESDPSSFATMRGREARSAQLQPPDIREAPGA